MGKRYLESDLNPAQDPVELVTIRAYIEHEQNFIYYIEGRSGSCKGKFLID